MLHPSPQKNSKKEKHKQISLTENMKDAAQLESTGLRSVQF